MGQGTKPHRLFSIRAGILRCPTPAQAYTSGGGAAVSSGQSSRRSESGCDTPLCPIAVTDRIGPIPTAQLLRTVVGFRLLAAFLGFLESAFRGGCKLARNRCAGLGIGYSFVGHDQSRDF